MVVGIEEFMLNSEKLRRQKQTEVSNAQDVLDATVDGLVERLRGVVEDSVEQRKNNVDDIVAYKEQVEHLNRWLWRR